MPEEFGTYQLIRKIAQGGMAEVFEARARGEIGGFSRPVAIKRMFPHLVDRDDIITMFIDEARIASRLQHPNIVQIYDLGVVKGSFYLAMELVEGLDLRRVCELGVKQDYFMSRELAARVIAEVARGLHYAHTRCDDQGRPMRVVHRDVSPQNVLLSVDGAVKICDFGIAKAESRLTHTRTGEFKGKFSYMSPEQFDGGKVDHRSDIFTLGIVLYEITTVSRLFRSRTEYETMRKITEGEITPPTDVRADYPEALERIVLKALARAPEERFEHAGQLAEALEDWLFERRVRVGTTQLAEYMQELEARAQADAEPVLSATPEGDDITRPVTISEQHFVLDDDDLEVLEDVDVIEERTRVPAVDVSTLQLGEGVQSEGPPEVFGAPVVEVRRISTEERARRQDSELNSELPVNSIDETLVTTRRVGDVALAVEPEAGDAEAAGDETLITTSEIYLSEHVVEEQAAEAYPPRPVERLEAEPQPRLDAGEDKGASQDDSFWRKIPDLKVASSRQPSPWSSQGQPAVTAAMATLEAERGAGVSNKVVWLGALLLIAALVGGLVWALGGASGITESDSDIHLQASSAAPGDMKPRAIATEPAGAAVIVNGVRLQGRTPLSVELASGRAHELWVMLDGYHPQRVVVGDEEALTPVSLERAVGSARARVSFESTPPGATIYLNGERLGVTPLRLENVAADHVSHVQLELLGHRPHVAWLKFQIDEDNTVSGGLAPEESTSTSVRVSSPPRSSRVTVDGQVVGSTPVEAVLPSAKIVELEISAHEHLPRSFALDLRRVASVQIDHGLRPADLGQGTLSLSVEPAAAIYIGGRSYGAGPVRDLELEEGTHTVIFETLEGRRLRAAVEIVSGKHLQLHAQHQGDQVELAPR
ncbi:serine/threonine-protein kinase [Lujinxingia litoralis]|nr:serine/threonine-protein kinase [Lujinxingia litoralis]